METFRGLKEIVEFEIIVRADQIQRQHNLQRIKSMAIEILQASECHKDCRCKYECGCAETNDCQDCSPPQRFLRIKSSSDDATRGPYRIVVEKSYTEIRVSSQRVLSTKII